MDRPVFVSVFDCTILIFIASSLDLDAKHVIELEFPRSYWRGNPVIIHAVVNYIQQRSSIRVMVLINV